MRQRAEVLLVNCSTKVNPIYDMQSLRRDYPMARTKDYLKIEANSQARVNLVSKMGMEHRVEKYKEEIRSYEYMVSKGIIPEAKTREEL